MKKLLYNRLYELSERYSRQLHIGLLGYGVTNKAALGLLLDFPFVDKITIRHKGISRVDLSELTTNAIERIRLIGENVADPFVSIDEDVLIPSPSVRRERLSLPDSTHVITDLDLLTEDKPKKLFAVSGSDGKSTTVDMASLLLCPTFPDIFTGGNIGTPLWQARSNTTAFLLELSSFNLRYTRFCGGRSLITNVTPNHLDWHSDLAEYEECKHSLIKMSSEPIINLADPVSERWAGETECFCLISPDMPSKEVRSKYKTEHTVTIESGVILLDGERIVSIEEARRKERHNLLNLASAIALSIGYTDRTRIREIAGSYEGLAERCESTVIDSITYVSSSIDTTPLRTVTTLKGLNKMVRIILGGRGKGLSLEPLREVLKEYALRIGIYGEIGEEIESFIDSDKELLTIPHKRFDLFDEAVDFVTEGVSNGDTVLLSPAATGYGEFRDYKDRASHFKAYIRKRHKQN